MGYQWNWGVFLQPSASGDDTYLGWMFAGFKMTIALSLTAWVIALLLGALVGVLRTVPNKTLAGIATAYVELFRNVPLLVQLFIWYFVLPGAVAGLVSAMRTSSPTQSCSSSSPRWSASACSPAPASPSRCARASTRCPRGRRTPAWR
jgi:glutamate/aspartate transport system permease protein